MGRRFEGTFLGFNQTELFYQTWEPEKPIGTFLITHGLAEHSECYEHLAQKLVSDGWLVIGWDLRGHGRSEGQRGYVEHFSEMDKDFRFFLDYVKRQIHHPGRPLVLFGHSLGGLLSLRLVLDPSTRGVTALVLSSPALGAALRPPTWKKNVAAFANRWTPQLTVFNEILYEDLIHDEDLQESYTRDPLRHDRISPRLFFGILEGMEELQERAGEFHLPILMQISGQDRIIDVAAEKRFFGALGSENKRLIEYPNSFHEVYNDHEQNKAVADLREFLKDFLS